MAFDCMTCGATCERAEDGNVYCPNCDSPPPLHGCTPSEKHPGLCAECGEPLEYPVKTESEEVRKLSTRGAQGDILTPEHAQWEEFTHRLVGPEGCDFQGDSPETFSSKCKGGMNVDYSRAILQTMPGIDVEGSLRYFAAHGGHCDCEVLFNVDPSVDSTDDQEP